MSLQPQISCETCPGQFLCHCLQVTEDQVVDAVRRLKLRTVAEIKKCTGAGDGCMACHRHLKSIIEVCGNGSCGKSGGCG